VRIRFRLQTNSSGTNDGWYIDDVCIQETATPELPFPFADDMEGGPLTEANWLPSAWNLVSSDFHSPSHSWEVNYGGGAVSYALTSAGTLDLSSSACPRLAFWHKGGASPSPRVEVSGDGGRNWSSLATVSPSSSWTRVELDLANYRSPFFRLRFVFRYGDWAVDDVEVREGPCVLVDWCSLVSPDSIHVGAGSETPDIIGAVSEAGVTSPPGQGADILADLGYGPDGMFPGSWPDSNWVEGAYIDDDGDRDVYGARLTIFVPGNYDFAFRFKHGANGAWTYADLDGNDHGSGGENGYTTDQSGTLVVSGESDIDVFPLHMEFLAAPQDSTSATLHIYSAGSAPIAYEILEVPADSSLSVREMSAIAREHRLLGRRHDDAARGDQTNPRWDVPWLRTVPTEGAVAPGDTADVQVIIDAEGLSAGAHRAYLVILNNDPDENPTMVVVDLMVEPVSGADELGPPSAFTWSSPAPNPGAEAVVFRYGLPHGSAVGLRIFDVSGRLIAEPAEGWAQAGHHSLRWDAAGLARGIYFYRFTAGDDIRKGRIVLR